MAETIKLPFSNVQLELLKLFADNVPDDELLEIKKILVRLRFKRLKEAANNIYDKKEWTSQDMEELLSKQVRKPYKSQENFLRNRSNS